MADAINAYIEQGLSTEWHTLSPETQSTLKALILDTLGAGVSGSASPMSQSVRLAKGAGTGHSEGHVHTWGGGAGRAPEAAFVNAFQAHIESFEAIHDASGSEPMAVVLAAAMAAAEARGQVSGKVFASGLAAGLDMALDLANASHAPPKFLRTSTAGLFGATLAVSRVHELDHGATLNALSHALSFTSGALQGRDEATPATAVQSAHAASSAITAVQLGAHGIEGPHDILEGASGYFSSFEPDGKLGSKASALREPGDRVQELRVKPFPTGREVQAGLVMVRRLYDRGILPAHVAGLTLSAPPAVKRQISRPWKPVMSPDYARQCFQYCGAVMLLNGYVGQEHFSEAALSDSDAARLAGRIRVVEDGRNDPTAQLPQSLRLNAAVGGDMVETLEAWPTEPIANGSDGVEHEKLRICLERCFDEDRGQRIADRLIHHVGTLEWIEDVSVISWLAAGKGDIQ